jgi:hypothetical protein
MQYFTFVSHNNEETYMSLGNGNIGNGGGSYLIILSLLTPLKLNQVGLFVCIKEEVKAMCYFWLHYLTALQEIMKES